MKNCFVIAPIGEPGTETRKRSDIILKYVIGPATESCGYTTLRADQISEPGLITSQVIQHVVDDALLIADLTDRNPNVFYELAIRHALRRPLVQIIKKGEQIPFDVAGTRTIAVDHHDLESVEETKEEIIRQIMHLENAPQEIETPISVAIELKFMRQSENPIERSLGDLVSAIADMKSEMSNFQKDTLRDQAQLISKVKESVERSDYLSRLQDKKFQKMIYRLDAMIEDNQKSSIGQTMPETSTDDDHHLGLSTEVAKEEE